MGTRKFKRQPVRRMADTGYYTTYFSRELSPEIGERSLAETEDNSESSTSWLFNCQVWSESL